MSELSADQVRAVCDRLTVSDATPLTAPALTGTTSPTEILATVQSAAGAAGLKLPPDIFVRIVAALAHSHVRIMGAPGTGKSTIAGLILQARQGDDWDFTLATGQWTGEDVIGGPVPDAADPRKLIFEPGLVLAAAEAGRWVGIDEINRADIDAAFGELFSLLAGFDTTLPYPPKPGSAKRVKIYAERPIGELDEGEYGIPPDWRMIATMNSWDKTSLSRVSFAFSRRWCTVYLPIPDPGTYEKIIDAALAKHAAANQLLVEEALKALFAEERATAPTLRSLGLGMGPGIAISCIKDIAACMDLGIAPGDAVVAAVEGFVLPQFEGQLEMHDDILGALMSAISGFGPEDSLAATLNDRLGVFTGKRSSSIF